MHDYNLFQHTPASTRIANGELHGHFLLGDAAYPPRSYMLPPYKLVGGRPLEPHEANFNYRQSASRMTVEHAYGILKARWRCLAQTIPRKL